MLYQHQWKSFQETTSVEWYYTYDFENRLTKVEYFGSTQTIILGQYFYDGDGKRIKKQESGETTVYIYSGIQVIYEKTLENGKETKYVGRVAKIEKVNGTETTTYFHMDHLGSTRGVTDATGNLITTLQYDPFGEVRSGSANGIKYTFTGKEQDATGLYYYGARFYDPKVGRFITRDLLAGSIGNPQTQNRYIYVTNNPLKYIDPTGNVITGAEDDDDNPGPNPHGTGISTGKVTKHPVDQVRLLELKLHNAEVALRSDQNSGWKNIQSLMNQGQNMLAVCSILGKASIPFNVNMDLFAHKIESISIGIGGKEFIITAFNEGQTGILGDTNCMNLSKGIGFINLNMGEIHLAGDLFLVLGHELIHAYDYVYDATITNVSTEYFAYSWQACIMNGIPSEYVSIQGSVPFNLLRYSYAFEQLYGGLPPPPCAS